MNINHNPINYISYNIFSTDYIFNKMDLGETLLQVSDTLTSKLSSPRLILFKNKGVVCVSCGKTGAYFSAESPKKGVYKNPHLNLYTLCGELMTKDHILPKAKGGKDHINNYQTMCSSCNSSKADS